MLGSGSMLPHQTTHNTYSWRGWRPFVMYGQIPSEAPNRREKSTWPLLSSPVLRKTIAPCCQKIGREQTFVECYMSNYLCRCGKDFAVHIIWDRLRENDTFNLCRKRGMQFLDLSIIDLRSRCQKKARHGDNSSKSKIYYRTMRQKEILLSTPAMVTLTTYMRLLLHSVNLQGTVREEIVREGSQAGLFLQPKTSHMTNARGTHLWTNSTNGRAGDTASSFDV